MNSFQKWLLLGSSIGTALTGVVYWWMQHMLTPVDEWAVINHPLQPLVLKLHIVVAPVLVFAVGLVAADHIWKHLRGGVRPGRKSGVSSLAALAPMVLSGYLIQAVTHATVLTVLVWLHVGTGVLYAVGLAVHVEVFRRRRRRRRHPGDAPVRTPERGTPVASLSGSST